MELDGVAKRKYWYGGDGDIYLLASVAARGVEETSTFARAYGRVKTLLGDVVTIGLHAGV